MIEDINEPIAVLSKFERGKIEPLRFKWRRRTYKIDKVNGNWERREGQFLVYYFSVATSNSGLFEIFLDSRNMGWRLGKIFIEG